MSFDCRTNGGRLVIVHAQTRMLTGGAEENTWASCLHQIEQGHIVHLVCGKDSNVEYYRARHPAVRVHFVPELVREVSWRHDIAAYRRLSHLFAELRADIVHTHTSKAGIIGRSAARSAGVPAIVHGVHMLPFSNVTFTEKAVYLFAERVLAPFTDHFVHVSNGTLRAYEEARIGSNRPHSVVRSGMDVQRFNGATYPDDWRELLGVESSSGKPRVILMLAAMEERKRHAEFIAGFIREVRQDEDVRLLLAGDGPEMSNVRDVVERLGAADHVRLVGHRGDPERLVALADVCVLSSLREGLPRVVVQSLAGGCPPVVSPLSGIEEVIDNGVNGIIVQAEDAGSVAREAVRLVRDEARLSAMSAAARDAPVSEWEFPSMFAQLDHVYAEVMASSAVCRRMSGMGRDQKSLGRVEAA